MNTDVIGTEFGGVLKNLIAVAIGIVDGVGYGENTKASILTRGLAEMTRLRRRRTARSPRRSPGLAGLGDLIATSQSPLLPQQHAPAACSARATASGRRARTMDQTAEGLASLAPGARSSPRAKGVDMPIAVAQVAGTSVPRPAPLRLRGEHRVRILTTRRDLPPARARGSPDSRSAGRDGMTRIALVFGGRSSEHSICCATAGGVLGAIDRDALRGRSRSASPATARSCSRRDDPDAFALDPAALPEVRRQRHPACSGPTRRPPASCGSRRPDGSTESLGAHRRRLPDPARAVRRGRHDPGPLRADRAALRRQRRARLRARHGQALHEDRAAGRRRRRRPVGHACTAADWAGDAGCAAAAASRRSASPCSSSRRAPARRVGVSKVDDVDGLDAGARRSRSPRTPRCSSRRRSSAARSRSRCSAAAPARRPAPPSPARSW